MDILIQAKGAGSVVLQVLHVQRVDRGFAAVTLVDEATGDFGDFRDD